MPKKLRDFFKLVPAKITYKAQAIKYAEEAATYILHKYCLQNDDSSLKKNIFPISPKQVALRLFISVKEGYEFMDKIPEHAIGTLVTDNHANKWPVIYVAPHDNQQRQRFTIAHCIGHFLYNEAIAMLDKPYKKTDYRIDSDKVNDEGDFQTVFANCFAANLLVPKSELITKLYTLPYINEDHYKSLAKYFNVSVQVIKFRLMSIGVLDREERIIAAKEQ